MFFLVYTERQILLNVLETLAIATDDNHQSSPPGFYTIQNYQMNGLDHQHHRSHSYPISLRPRQTSSSHRQSKSNRGSYSKHHKQQSKKKSDTESVAVYNGGVFGLHGKRMTMSSKYVTYSACRTFMKTKLIYFHLYASYCDNDDTASIYIYIT